MQERMTFSGGPLTGAVIEAEFLREGIDTQSSKRYPSRIHVEYDTAAIKENAELFADVPFAHGRRSLVAEYELDYETGCYYFSQWSMKPETPLELDNT